MFWKSAALCAGLLFVCQPAQAVTIDLVADIDANQEVPPTGSLAFGTGVFTYDDVENVLSWMILFTAALFDSPEVAAHIHGPAPIDMEADILIDLGVGQFKEGMQDLDTLATCPDVQACEDALLGSLWYVNIHSVDFPEGEIRGQILPVGGVPEPASLLLVAAGAAAGLARRRLLA